MIPSREPGSFRSIALILQRKSARGRRPHWRRPGLRRERNFSFDIGALTAISDGGLGMLPIHTQWFTIPRLSPAFTAGHKGWSRSNSSVGGSSGGAKLPRSRGRCAIGANRPAQCHELRVWRLESFRARQRTAGFRRRSYHRFSPSRDIPTDSPQRTPAGVFLGRTGDQPKFCTDAGGGRPHASHNRGDRARFGLGPSRALPASLMVVAPAQSASTRSVPRGQRVKRT